ncbi:MAG: Stp1/IreP family PP2C-type Ser/Thr phosphatase [Deltaproteobacteria bacterium]|nr:Stp1/IreP family PP2C-type Ser/Thr phosphatase [Deltaproteobacteria bacterium]
MLREVRSHSDIGKMREENQDSLAWSSLDENLQVLIVADGMGGYAGGSLASKTITETMIKEFSMTPVESIKEKPSLYIRKAITAGNAAVNSKAEKNREFKDMGSTVVCALAVDSTLHVAYVGDSRAYILRRGQIRQITEDHTVVQDLVKNGYVSPEDAPYHPSSGILTKCLGQMEIADPEFSKTIELKEGDAVILCSDGLSGMLEDDEIGEIVLHEPREKAVDELIDLANDAGGFDNITVIVFYFGEMPPEASSWPVTVGIPLYEENKFHGADEPTVPFAIAQKGREKLKDTMYITTQNSPDTGVRKSLLGNSLLPLLISVIILLMGFLIWLAGGISF